MSVSLFHPCAHGRQHINTPIDSEGRMDYLSGIAQLYQLLASKKQRVFRLQLKLNTKSFLPVTLLP